VRFCDIRDDAKLLHSNRHLHVGSTPNRVQERLRYWYCTVGHIEHLLGMSHLSPYAVLEYDIWAYGHMSISTSTSTGTTRGSVVGDWQRSKMLCVKNVILGVDYFIA
jgi:hypothetical protein